MTNVILSRQERIDALSERDGYFCYICRKGFDEDKHRVTLDHVTPLSKGGSWDLSNLKLAGFKCNQEKADRLWVDDGFSELEPKSEREGYHARRQNRNKILEQFCELCYDGRLLLPMEECPDCGREAVARPWTTKQEPKNCTHSGYDWCWCCSIGIYERVPAIVTVLDGDVLDGD